MGAVFAHDDSRLITTDVQGNVRRWNIDDRGQPEAFESAGGQLWSIRIDARREGPCRGRLHLEHGNIVGRDHRSETSTLSGHVDRVWSVAISPDGKTLASGSNDLTIRLWDVAAGEQRGVIPIPASYVFTLAISPTAKPWPPPATIIGSLASWDLPSRAEKSPLGQHPACVRRWPSFPTIGRSPPAAMMEP